MPRVMFGNYEPDVASVLTSNTSYVKNVVPRPDGFGPFNDLGEITEALGARCLGFLSVLDTSGNSHFFAGTQTALWKLNATTRAWADVSRTSGGAYAVGEREYWDFAVFGSNIIAVTDSNAPQLYTLNSSTNFAALGGSPPQARYATVVGDFLVLAGLTSNPNRIHWSGLNNITQWTPGTNSCDYQDFPSGGNAVRVSGGEFGMVLQDSSIRRMVFNPGPTIFDFSIVSEEQGIRLPYSMVRAQSATFFYGSDGFYKLNPSGELVPIGANRVNDTITNDLDQTSPRYMVGAHDPLNRRIVWCYKSTGNTNPAYLDKMAIYDWFLDKWSLAEIGMEFIGTATPLATTLEGLDVLGSLDTLPFSLDTYVNTPKFRLAGFATNHKAGFFDGSALEATIDTPEIGANDFAWSNVRRAAPIGDAPGCYVSMGRRANLQAAKAYTSETLISSRTGFAPVKSSGAFQTGRIRVPAGSSWTYLRGVEGISSLEGVR